MKEKRKKEDRKKTEEREQDRKLTRQETHSTGTGTTNSPNSQRERKWKRKGGRTHT